MALTKRVKIYTESFIEELSDNGAAEDAEKTFSEAEGELSFFGESILLSYAENSADTQMNSKITVSKNGVTVKKSGSANYEFVFIEGGRTEALYSVPPYSFDTEIYTRRIRNSLSLDGGEISLIYDMTIGGAKRKTAMKIRVTML